MPMPDDAMERISVHSGLPSPVATSFESVPSVPYANRDRSTSIAFSDDVVAHRYAGAKDARAPIHAHELLGTAHHHPASSEMAAGVAPPVTIRRGTADSNESTRTYRDPYAPPMNVAFPSRGQPIPTAPQTSIPTRSTDATASLAGKMSNFLSTPDLSLSDPRAGDDERSQGRLKSFFGSSQGQRFGARRGSQSAEDEEEREGLVRSPRTDRFGPSFACLKS